MFRDSFGSDNAQVHQPKVVGRAPPMQPTVPGERIEPDPALATLHRTGGPPTEPGDRTGPERLPPTVPGGDMGPERR